MNSVYQTGPGFYAANTAQEEPTVTPGKMRVYCARLEAYEIDADSELDHEVSFDVLFAKAEGDPQLARALLLLGDSIQENRIELEGEARL